MNSVHTDFFELVKIDHRKRGFKNGKYMLEDIELSEAWEHFAESVQSVLEGKNPTQIKQRLIQLTNASLYVHEMLERDTTKPMACKIADERQKRLNDFAVTPRKVGINE